MKTTIALILAALGACLTLAGCGGFADCQTTGMTIGLQGGVVTATASAVCPTQPQTYHGVLVLKRAALDSRDQPGHAFLGQGITTTSVAPGPDKPSTWSVTASCKTGRWMIYWSVGGKLHDGQQAHSIGASNIYWIRDCNVTRKVRNIGFHPVLGGT